MTEPTFDISDAFDNSPKTDSDITEINPAAEKRVNAQNVNQSQNEFGYFWASASVALSKENQNKTARSVANYVFENILEDKSTIENHSLNSDLYIADRINYQNNPKSLSDGTPKGVFFFIPKNNNKSSLVNLQFNNLPVYRLLKKGSNDKIIELEIDDLKANNIYMIFFNYQTDAPFFLLYNLVNGDLIEKVSGKYKVNKKVDMTTYSVSNPSLSDTFLNTTNGVLLKDKVNENETEVKANAIYNIYKIDLNGVIHYRENKLRAGDIIFVLEDSKFYYFDGTYLFDNGVDGRYAFDAYTEIGTEINVNTDRSDLVYIRNISGNKNIRFAGTPKHMQKLQIFLDVVSIGTITFPSVGYWLDNIELQFLDNNTVYPFCFIYDAYKGKWIGNKQGVYR